MKIRAIPLLNTPVENDGKTNGTTNSNAILWDLNEMTASSTIQFGRLMDQYKAMIFQKESDSTGEESFFSVDDFGQLVAKDLHLDYYPYIGGAAPRTIVPVKASPDRCVVFTSNESPPDQPIPFHHELAQTSSPPKYIFFYCDTPSETGGETPIIDSTAVYRYVAENFPGFIMKLNETGGVRYIRTLPAETDTSSPIGRSYQDTYNVTNKQELENKLKEIKGCSWEWREDGSIRIVSEIIPAIRLITDASSSMQNYVFQYTFCNSIIAAYLGWEDSRNNRKEAVRFGDMSFIEEEVLENIAKFMETNRIMYRWKKGDIMAIDNQLVMHSRNPFSGKRRVLASIWGSIDSNTLSMYNQQQVTSNGVAVGLRSISDFTRNPLQPADPLVFGFWKVSKDVCADVCYNAIKAGYRRLDCACDYGNEQEVGIGIQRAVSDGLCKREDLFITSKLWNTYHEPQYVKAACQRTLDDLRISYLDEYLVHFPISMEYVPFHEKYPPEWTNLNGKMVLIPNDVLAGTWKAMEALVEDKLCLAIGICNFSTSLLRQLLSTCRIIPSTLQIELHPYNTQDRLVRLALSHGIKVTAFSVFGASSYFELNMATPDESFFTNPLIVQIAKTKNKSPAQILIRWAMQRNTLPLSKTNQYTRMIENRNVFDFYLTVSEMEEISKLNKNRRYNDPGQFCLDAFGTFCPIYD